MENKAQTVLVPDVSVGVEKIKEILRFIDESVLRIRQQTYCKTDDIMIYLPEVYQKIIAVWLRGKFFLVQDESGVRGSAINGQNVQYVSPDFACYVFYKDFSYDIGRTLSYRYDLMQVFTKTKETLENGKEGS